MCLQSGKHSVHPSWHASAPRCQLYRGGGVEGLGDEPFPITFNTCSQCQFRVAWRCDLTRRQGKEREPLLTFHATLGSLLFTNPPFCQATSTSPPPPSPPYLPKY